MANKVCGNLLLAAAAGLLVAVDPTFINFSLEVRPYALLQLVGAWQVYVFLILLDGSPSDAKRWRIWAPLLFGVFTAIGCYLHYTFLLLLAPEGLFMILLVAAEKPLRRDRLGQFFGWLALPSVLCLPFLGHIGYLLSRRATLGSYIQAEGPEIIFTRFGTIPYIILPLSLAWIVQCVSNWKGITASDNQFAQRLRRYLIFAVLWFLLPSAFVWVTTKCGILRVNLDRFVAASAIAPVLIAVTLCALFSSRTARAIFTVVLLAYVPAYLLIAELGEKLPQYQPKYQRAPMWQAAASFVNRECADSRPVFVRSLLVEEEWLNDRRDGLLKEYLLCTVNSLYAIKPDSPRRMIEPLQCLPLPPSQTETIIRARRVCLRGTVRKRGEGAGEGRTAR